MKRAVSLFVLFAMTLPLAAGKTRAARSGGGPSPADVRYLDAARGIAAWLETLEISGPDGVLSWPMTPGSPLVLAGLDHGAAGIGAFHLKLYQVTREPRYLQKAEGAAAFVRERYATRPDSHEWLGGMAGGGEFFLAMYDETGAQVHRDAVARTADALLAKGLRDEPGLHWQHANFPRTYVGLAHGAAGAGLFLVHAYELTRDERYLDAARDAVVWMLQHQIQLGGGTIGWKRLTVDTAAINTWCGGSTGIVHFLRELHRVTGEPRYAELSRATLEGLLREGVTVQPNDQLAWRYNAPAADGPFITVHCHGGTSNAALLARAGAESGDARYRDAADATGRWLDAIAVPRETGASWGQLYGWLIGTASVGHASVQLYAAHREPAHLSRARKAADYLLTVADRPAPGQMRWATGDGTGEARFETGWYTGSAGIGLFYLELYESMRGHKPLAPFSPLNP